MISSQGLVNFVIIIISGLLKIKRSSQKDELCLGLQYKKYIQT